MRKTLFLCSIIIASTLTSCKKQGPIFQSGYSGQGNIKEKTQPLHKDYTCRIIHANKAETQSDKDKYFSGSGPLKIVTQQEFPHKMTINACIDKYNAFIQKLKKTNAKSKVKKTAKKDKLTKIIQNMEDPSTWYWQATRDVVTDNT